MNRDRDMQTNSVSINIDPNKSRGRIDPNIYGLHLEHIWNCVYPCVWVGPESPIANIDGIRKDVVELLSNLRPTVCKYPGGYFTDFYDWRDGVGPRNYRPVRVCPTEPNQEESNQFGTAEFIKFCRMIGAEPFLSVNAMSMEPNVAAQWVEYCNRNGNTYWAVQRRKDGYKEPFRVRYWAIGNEQYWLHSAEEYVERYRRWAHCMYNTDPEIILVMSGAEPGMIYEPWNSDGTWGERFLRLTQAGQVLFPGDWHPKADKREVFYSFHPYFNAPVHCTAEEYYANIAELIRRLPNSITTTVKLLDAHRGEYPRPRLCFDEYGLLHPGLSMAGNMTQPTPFWSALWLGCFFHICHEHPTDVGMATLPGTVNMEHALVLLKDARAIATPSYYLFNLYRAHGGAESLETIVSGAPWCDEIDHESLWALTSLPAGSNKATLSVINLDLDKNICATIAFSDNQIRDVSGSVLNSPDIHACNTSDSPSYVIPRKVLVSLVGGRIVHTFPAHSVTVLDIGLNPKGDQIKSI